MAGASRPEGKKLNPSTSKTALRCFKVGGVTFGVPALRTRSKPLVVPV